MGVTVAIAGCNDTQADLSDGSDGGSGGSGGGGDEPADSDGDGVPNDRDDFPNDSNRTTSETNQGSAEIAEDEWYRWRFDWDEETHIEYEVLVRSGPELDTIFMPESEYDHFEEGNRYQYSSALSDTGTRLTASGWLESGGYVLAIDNSNRGDAEPPTNFDDDVAEVEYELIASR